MQLAAPWHVVRRIRLGQANTTKKPSVEHSSQGGGLCPGDVWIRVEILRVVWFAGRCDPSEWSLSASGRLDELATDLGDDVFHTVVSQWRKRVRHTQKAFDIIEEFYRRRSSRGTTEITLVERQC